MASVWLSVKLVSIKSHNWTLDVDGDFTGWPYAVTIWIITGSPPNFSPSLLKVFLGLVGIAVWWLPCVGRTWDRDCKYLCCKLQKVILVETLIHAVCVQGDKGVMQLMLGRHNASAPLSSYSSSNVEVKGQSYFFTYTVKALTVTTTARGITSKQLLLGTVSDQVC